MKLILLCVLLTCFSSGTFADGFPTRGELYVTQCDQFMGLFGKEAGPAAIEKRFVELANTPGKMLQLIFDYDLVFSKPFAEAAYVSVQERVPSLTVPTKQNLLQIRALADLSEEEMDKFIWETVDRSVEIKSTKASTSQGQVTYLQAKNIVTQLKASPNRKLFESFMRIFMRQSLLELTLDIYGKYHSTLTEPRSPWWWIPHIISAGIGTYFGIEIGSALDPSTLHIGAVFGGVFGTELGLLPSLVVMDKTEKRKVRKYEASLDRPTGERAENLVSALDQRLFRPVSNSIFSFLSEDVTYSILSLKHLFQTPTLQMSPVQIAYLGHVDILELQALSKALNEAVKTTQYSEALENIRASVRAVYDSPLNYSAAMSLLVDLEAFVGDMTPRLKLRKEAARALTTYAEEISRIQNEAVNKPYSDRPKSKEDIGRYEILLQKIRDDWSHLQQLRINTDAISRKTKDVQTALDKVATLLKNAPQGQDGWKKFAEELLLALDDLR